MVFLFFFFQSPLLIWEVDFSNKLFITQLVVFSWFVSKFLAVYLRVDVETLI